MAIRMCEKCGRLEYDSNEDLEKAYQEDIEPEDFVCDRCK